MGSEDYLGGGINHSFGIKPEIPNKFKTPAPNAYNSDKSEDYLEGGINHSFGIKPEIPNKFKTPAPNAYYTDKGEDYLEGGIKHSFGIKPELKNKFKTPAPNVYDTDKGENYLEGVKALSMGERLKEAKKFLTPAPNKYEAVIPEDKPSFAFGVKHSPYLYSGRELGRGDLWQPRQNQCPMVTAMETLVPMGSSDREVEHSQETSQQSSALLPKFYTISLMSFNYQQSFMPSTLLEKFPHTGYFSKNKKKNEINDTWNYIKDIDKRYFALELTFS